MIQAAAASVNAHLEVLTEHEPAYVNGFTIDSCACGWQPTPAERYASDTVSSHRLHVARALADFDLLILAAVWDEGYRTFEDEAAHPFSPTLNPYKSEPA